MFMPKSKGPNPLADRTTDWRRFNHELRLLSEQINRYHHSSSTQILKTTSLPSQRY